ncbi:hypothetical protein Tco_0026258, partial [Tanacetum coccineum]
TVVANSTTEAEYIAASHCCGQVLWIKNQMLDYGYNFMETKIHVDNESAICVVKNHVYHSKTNHIEIMHHFIRYSYEKRLIEMVKIHTNNNVAGLLTKAFDVSRFNFLVASIYADGISSLPNTEIFDQLTLMGYVSNEDKLTFQKVPPGSVVRFLGIVCVPPGSVFVVPPGSVVVPPGSVVVPPGSVVVTTGSVVVPPGSVVVTTGSVVVTTGSVVVTF